MGGMIGLGDTHVHLNKTSFFLEEHSILLVNVRSGIKILTDLLSPPQVWMPSYLCDVMIEAIKQSTSRIRFYEVNYKLEISSSTWLDDIHKGDIVIFIDYFGFPIEHSIAHEVKGREAWVIEDASQALLSDTTKNHADFVLFSPRKFLGVPDGGILTTHCEIKLDHVHLKPPPEKWWLNALEAVVL